MSTNPQEVELLPATLPPPGGEAQAVPTLGPEPDAADQAVPKIPGYEILAELGRGGMGVVFRARQTSANRLVALKMILAGQLASPADVQRFRAEAEAAAHLDHPNIVPIFEVNEHAGAQFFSMKLIEEATLADWIKTHCRPDQPSTAQTFRGHCEAAVGILAKVARAVHHAHQRGILHRDLKPGNVLLDGAGDPYVTDFGLAKRVEGDSGLTRTGAIMGTPSYMAPEQARAARSLSTAADVYSLGAMLYELLTGRPPFQGPSPLDTVMQVLEQEPLLPRRLNPAIDRDLEIVCLKCLEKDPAKRYGSAEALAEELERWLRGEAIVARPVGQVERSWRWCRRNPAIAALGAALIAVVVIGLITITALYFQEQWQRQRFESQEAAALKHLAEATRQKERAETSYRLARDTLQQVLKVRDDPRLQAGALEDLQKQFAQAEGAFYEKFLQLRGDDPAFQGERAKALAGYSSLSYRMGNMEQALRQIQEGVAIAESLRPARPEDAELARSLAGFQMQTATVSTKLGRLDEAIRANLRAGKLYAELLARNPEDADLLDAAAMAQQNLGVAYRGAGRLAEGEKALRQALDMLEKLPAQSAADTRRTAASRAIIWSNLAEFYPRMKRPSDAATAFEKALALFEDLARQEPDDETHTMNLASVRNNFGLFLQDQGRTAEAAATWKKAIAVFQQLVEKHPTEHQYRHALAMTHDNLGMLLVRASQPDQARVHFDQALKLWTRLHADNPRVIEYISDLGCVQRNLGDLERSLNQKEAALDWYAKAIATLEQSPSRNEIGTNSHTWLQDAAAKRAALLKEREKP